MPLDAICLTALTAELSPLLTGARIDKVQQPARDLLLLSVYTRQGNRRLLLSAGVGTARIHFTNARVENPDAPPMFCMLLRKHLAGARIASVTQPEFERMVILELDTRDELGLESKKQLIVELMGRSSNVILVDNEGLIIDCMRRADFGEDAYRRLLPGMIYRLPLKPKKPCFFDLSSQERRQALDSAPDDVPLDKWLMDSFSGLSPLISRELAYRAGERALLPAAMDALADSVAAAEFTPTLIIEGGAARDFSFMSIGQYGAQTSCETLPDFSELLDAFYARRDHAERMRRAAHDTTKNIRTLRDRQARKLAQQREELRRSVDRDALRHRGDLITANLWRMEKGACVLVCEDYYTEGSPTVEIGIDPLKTPQQNAAAAYKDYKKEITAEKYLTALIADGEKQLDYLESVLDQLARAESERDVVDIRRELSANGIIRAKAEGKQKVKPRGPMRFASSSGYEILIGRSNLQNDELTTKTARRTDIWLHTQRVHGSHVIIRANDETPDEQTLAEAASLAAYYSQARDGGKTPVDYTQIRFVKKPSGAMPGKVIYTDYKTIMAEPDVALAESLRTEK